MMKRNKPRRIRFGYEQSLTSFTSMVDVVFLLLVYFVLTFHASDVFAHLSVNRPGPIPDNESAPITLLTVSVAENGYAINETPMDFDTLAGKIETLAGISTDQDILVQCSTDSTHEDLVAVLDLCAKVELTRISVVSGRK